jgi:antitoxin FitA
MMAELILTDVDEEVLHQLLGRAAGHGRTPEDEAKVILSEVLQGDTPGVWAKVDAIYSRLAASRQTFSDSADLLREDRDR